VFVRELISNAADACEKLRFLQARGQPAGLEPDKAPGIQLTADESAGTLTVADSGVGMTRDELVTNLGTIAHSGTKAFLKALAEKQQPDARLIGQFGVGFYSAFMAATRVTVLTRSHAADSQGWRWVSEGGAGYSIEPAPDLPRGTQVVLQLKDDAKEFAQKDRLQRLIQKYSNFVGFPVELNGDRVNSIQAIWARSKSEVKDEEYREFYEFLTHESEAPRYRLHFTADAPIALQALLFVPAKNFEALGMSRQEAQVHLHCRKVLIDAHPKGLLPEWLRFLRGVVDSEDLPLNVSRERMQDSELIRKLSRALTNKFLKFLGEEAAKDVTAYNEFYAEFSRFLKEGLLSDWDHREAIGKLLRYESSTTEPGKTTSLADYVARMPEGQTEIYYQLARDRAAAEASPYFEVFRAKRFEVLFVDDAIDEFALDRLGEFEGKKILSAEKADLKIDEAAREGALSEEETKALSGWLKTALGTAVNEVSGSQRLVDSPVVVVDSDRYMTASMRRTLKMMGRGEAGLDPAPNLELNPRHPVIVRLNKLRDSDATLAGLVANQLFDQARLAAGRLDDPRAMLTRLNELLAKVVGA
jgi:TNF receptor-associated protein 1